MYVFFQLRWTKLKFATLHDVIVAKRSPTSKSHRTFNYAQIWYKQNQLNILIDWTGSTLKQIENTNSWWSSSPLSVLGEVKDRTSSNGVTGKTRCGQRSSAGKSACHLEFSPEQSGSGPGWCCWSSVFHMWHLPVIPKNQFQWHPLAVAVLPGSCDGWSSSGVGS